jgi:hypothetical protein
VPLDLTWVSVPASVDIELEESDVVLNLPAGTYACDLPSGATVAEEIVCDEASEFPLRVALEEGTVVVDAVAAD